VAKRKKLKAFRSSVNVLAMSATPVPRSLHFSLSGLRDMSLIETAAAEPPAGAHLCHGRGPEPAARGGAGRTETRGQIFFGPSPGQGHRKVADRLRPVPKPRCRRHGQMPKTT